MDDDGCNQTKRTLESLFLTIPEESMRVQFRYEVVENVGSLLERYEAARTTTLDHVIAMDQQRVDEWRAADRAGEFLRASRRSISFGTQRFTPEEWRSRVAH